MSKVTRTPFKFKLNPIAASILGLTLAGAGLPIYAQEDDDSAETLEEVITIGTRRQARSASDTVAPVDVISTDDILDQAGVDVSDLIRTVVPSYQVNTQPISDAATLVRPANLRGLSPDNTLVLLNGKRRHRAAVITFLGGGISDGSHGPDIGVFPTLGLKQVEVLRDGASSQYGADAIAGVMNFTLKDADEGGTAELKYGSTYEGDGDNLKAGVNIGFPLTSDGFINLTAEFAQADGTFRAVQRDDAAALIAAGNTDVASVEVNTVTADYVQYWGAPDVEDDIKLAFNSAIEFSESAELYAFGNYASRTVEGGFFFRNPTNRGGVYAGPLVDPVTGAADPDGVDSVLVGDISADGSGGCPAGIPLTGTDGLIPDAAILASIYDDVDPVTGEETELSQKCYSFLEDFPGGFTPRFGGDLTDFGLVLGLRGMLGDDLAYDVSYSEGENKAEFFIYNTINASLGPTTPTSFKPGAYTQHDKNFNIDFTLPVEVSFLASDLNIATGFEYREERFIIDKGDPQSYEIGVLSAASDAYPTGQGFSSSSNGFGGFTRATDDTQDNIALYVDLEADVIDMLTLQAAVRYEDFNTFGDTTNYKLGALVRATDFLVFRSTYSTGFHAPTTGQANVTNVTTQAVGGVLVDQGTLPLSSAAGQFVNDQLDGIYTLGPEEATNFSLGAGVDIGPVNVTIDYFNIEVDDRIAITDQQNFQELLIQVADEEGVTYPADPQTSQLLNALDAAGIIEADDFAGSEDLVSFGFFANDFDTKTQGIDLVASTSLELFENNMDLALAFNWTDTEVTRRGNLSDTRLRQLEDSLPAVKGNISARYYADDWRLLARMNYHGDYYEAHLDDGSLPIEGDPMTTFDLEFAYTLFSQVDIIIGAANIFDEYPEENPWAGVAGSKYPATAPFGFAGGQYYVRALYSF